MRPQDAVRRQRVGVKAFVAVDGRVGKSGQRRAVFQQPADVVIPGIAQQVLIANKRIRPGFPVPQRLVQVPPARIHVGQRRFRHEAGQQAVAPHQVLDRGAEQQQGIRCGETAQGVERHLELARPPIRPRWCAGAGPARRPCPGSCRPRARPGPWGVRHGIESRG